MSHGGKRTGAGRKQLSNRYKEKTHPIRVPVSLLPTIQILLQDKTQQTKREASHRLFMPDLHSRPFERPLFTDAVSAGTPFTAEDRIDQALDLNTHLIPNPSSTFFVRVAGDSMTGASIFDGDLLIVDRSLKARSGNIVVAIVEGNFTVKRFIPTEKGVLLQSENPLYSSLFVSAETEASVWGVVRHVIHQAQ